MVVVSVACVCAAYGMEECQDVNYSCFSQGLQLCGAPCKAKGRSMGSTHVRSRCFGTFPHEQCCCTVFAP